MLILVYKSYMAGEWIAPVAGAAVGISGIAATFWSSKGQRELQQKLTQSEQRHRKQMEILTIRREIYARYLTFISGAASDKKFPFNEWMLYVNELTLFAGSGVRKQAVRLGKSLHELSKAQALGDEIAIAEMQNDLVDEQTKIAFVMRNELLGFKKSEMFPESTKPRRRRFRRRFRE